MVYEWYVITGGPCSGKTTIINELSKLGFFTVPEAAREILEREKVDGKRVEEIRKNELEFQIRVLWAKIRNEMEAPRDRIVFFDRGIPDSIAYYEFMGIKHEELMEYCKDKKYKKVFFLELLPFKKDDARIEDEEKARKLSELIQKVYTELGYDVIKIPVLPIKERVKMILEHVKKNI